MKLIWIFSASLVALVTSILPQKASADFIVKGALGYLSHSTGDNGTSSTSSRMNYDLGLDYRIKGGGLLIGGLYQNESQSTGSATLTRTSYGASVGWMEPSLGPYIIATYFISSTYEPYTNGKGYQADLGYLFKPGGVALGFQLSYKNYSYSPNNHTDTYIEPCFTAMFEF